VPGCMGVTELGDGRAILILEAPGLIQLASRRQHPTPRRQHPTAQQGRNQAVNTPQAASDHFIVFELAGSTYAVRSRDVQLIDMVDHITPVPNARASVEGLVFSRGDILPAINLRTQFGFEKIPYGLRTRLLVIQHAGRKVGLIVDTAREFLRIAADAVTPPPDTIGGIGARYLEGIARLDERLILIVNLDALLDLADVSAALATI
jgi:chemotaxis signal transduction protein